MPVFNLGSLSEEGWVNNPSQLLDFLISHFMLSNYSQTYFYKNKVSSLPWIIQNYSYDIDQTVSQIKSTLENYLSRYFKSVDVEVGIDPSTLPDGSKIALSLYVQVTDNQGVSVNLNRLIESSDGKLASIIDYSNNG